MNKPYTTSDIAAMYHVEVNAVCEWIHKGLLEATKGSKPGTNAKVWLITESSLRKFQRKQLDKYIDEKLEILKELHIEPTWRQMEHLRRCETEFAVDAFYHDLITGKTRIK